jgi:hypothetical protein
MSLIEDTSNMILDKDGPAINYTVALHDGSTVTVSVVGGVFETRKLTGAVDKAGNTIPLTKAAAPGKYLFVGGIDPQREEHIAILGLGPIDIACVGYWTSGIENQGLYDYGCTAYGPSH